MTKVNQNDAAFVALGPQYPFFFVIVKSFSPWQIFDYSHIIPHIDDFNQCWGALVHTYTLGRLGVVNYTLLMYKVNCYPYISLYVLF